MHPATCADQQGWGRWRAAPLRVGSPAHPRNSPERISGDPEAEHNARARCSGPPCTTPQLLLQLRSVYRARPSATRRSLTTATACLQSLRGSSTRPTRIRSWKSALLAAGNRLRMQPDATGTVRSLDMEWVRPVE